MRPTFFWFVTILMAAIGIVFLWMGSTMSGVLSLMVAFNSLGFDSIIMEIRKQKSPG